VLKDSNFSKQCAVATEEIVSQIKVRTFTREAALVSFQLASNNPFESSVSA
jgi:hypothetical protein